MKRKKWHVLITSVLVASTTIQSFAAGWQQLSDGSWSWALDDNTTLKNSWQQDIDGKWYHLDQNGIMQIGWIMDEAGNRYFLCRNTGDPQGSMVSGWKLIDNEWYFFNTLHDGTFGRMLTGWQWVDGYCYYLGTDGKMYANTTTPDGYTVNANGAWTENGTPVYIAGKGFITKTGPSGLSTGNTRSTSGGGGGGGSHGGGSSSGGSGGGSGTSKDEDPSPTETVPTYKYSVVCVDSENGDILGSYEKSGKKGTILIFDYEFDGYDLVGGDSRPELTKDGEIFTLYYKKTEEKPEETTYRYTIRYVDADSGEALEAITGSGQKNETVQAEKKDFSGYKAVEGTLWSFKLTNDNLDKIIYYQRDIVELETYSYEVKYLCKDDDTELGVIRAEAEAGKTVLIESLEFNGYVIQEGQDMEFVADEDNKVIIIYYDKKPSIATPSEPEKELYEYTVECIDFETDEVLATFIGSGEPDEEISISYSIDGYTPNEEYSFVLDSDGMTFKLYYTKDSREEEKISYTILCVDSSDRDNVLATLTRETYLGYKIMPVHEIEGYTMQEPFLVEITENGQVVILEFTKIEEKEQFEFTIYQYDITTKEKLGEKIFYGAAGEEINLTGLDIDGYELLGNISGSVVVSDLPSNNVMNVYYKEITEYEPEKKDVNYTIQFVDSVDGTTHILGDVTGTGKDGEEVPYYFVKRLNTTDGRIWQAIDDSPKIFKLDSTTVNVFTVSYINVGTMEEEEKQLYPYCIRYIAEDTGAVLGVNSGYATAGTKVDFRGSFAGYGFKDMSKNFMRVTENEEENEMDILFKRTAFPGPERNPITGLFDGSEWNVYFVDQQGNSLLPPVKGFSLKDDYLFIDYPSTIELGDGMVYRAEYDSPYMEVQKGITYKQIFIRYEKGDTSDSKLEQWKKTAQEAKNEILQETPYEYKVIYRERNSWNDIAVFAGIDAKNRFVNIPAVSIDGYTLPDTSLGSFTLSENGMVEYADYVKYSQGSSNQGNRLAYKVSFKDKDGNDLFAPYTGRVSAPSLNSVVDLPVYYPDSFTDTNGNMWEAEIKSPQTFKIDMLDTKGNENTVYYRKVYENPMTDMIVEKESEALAIFREFLAHTEDSEEKEFYLIGKDYNPKDMIPGELQAIYSSSYHIAPLDTFEIDGTTYTVCRVRYKRSFTENNCTHKWQAVETTVGGCLVSGSEKLQCVKCGKTHSIILPALGHVDKNHDTVCDNCGSRAFPNNIGDELILNFKSGSMDIGNYQYRFVCIDDNYNGEGKMLYICEEDITSSVYGEYSHDGLASFETSDLKAFLNEEFLDGLGELRDAMLNVDANRVSMLTKEQYDKYLANSINRYEFPEGTFLTSTLSADGERIVLSNGVEVTPQQARNYGVRPLILLDKPDATETTDQTVWKVGDIQARTIGNQTYLFRCVSENYKDKTNTSKRLALFLCETVIPADIVNNPSTDRFETMFFGETNNYKYSTLNEWLEANSTDALFSLSKINVGVDSSYNGQTTKFKYSQLNPNELTKTDFRTTQAMYSNLFVLSVEEALQYKDYLWKFDNSNTENPETQVRQYCTGYWLRTPQTGTDDKIYAVNLHNGNIEPVSVKATEGNDYSTIGIRPAFVMPQYE